MEDVKTKRGADISPPSCGQDETEAKEGFDSWTNSTTKIPRLTRSSKEEKVNMEDKWKWIKKALTSTCREVLECKRHHHKEWISIETLDKIQERKIKKTAINNNQMRTEKVKEQA
ncbi:unnamed protein product [Schistosoma mattheei]|uniref:Uncharacterized protein n=1 Tax=Schistosoma mattheei TaxID=31246 RepID=A0A183NVW4_9TREM|nr:unnamed protein product [Schistosoma mattheei]